MRRSVIATAFALCLLAGGLVVAQTGGMTGTIWGPASYNVTVSSGGVIVASLQLPPGTVLMAVVQGDEPRRLSAGGHSVFSGEVELRARSEGVGVGRNVRVDTMMENAPLVLTVSDAEVIIERMRP